MNKTRLRVMYFYWMQTVMRDGRIDFIGSRFWLIRTFGMSENTAKHTIRMFYAWLINGVAP